MFEKEFNIAILISLLQKEEVDAAQQRELDNWLAEDPANMQLWQILNQQDQIQARLNVFENIDEQRGWQKVIQQISGVPKQVNRPGLRLWTMLTSAAAILICLSIGIYFYSSRLEKSQPVKSTYANDILPGKQGATLTLANGKQVVLNNTAEGKIAQESGVSISKSGNGSIEYEIKDALGSDLNLSNTLTTAKGETYRLRLPDGSVVWLNAGSSLTFSPSLRNGGARRVELTGEAYFEISKDKIHPFVVHTTSQQVTVLGTQFNINSYADEPATTTTLLEGSIQLNIGSIGSRILVPGEQAKFENGLLGVRKANLQEVVAWKNGYFRFNDEPIESVMRKLARWYNIDVSYSGSPKGERFTGKLSRENNISQILNAMESTKAIHFKVEGRRVTVIQ